jgi:hypothetical protein
MNKDNLTKSLEALKQSIDRSNSVKQTFFLGVVRGIGAVIGATVLAGLLLGFAAATFEQAEDIPLIGDYVSGFSDILKGRDSPE